MGLGFRDITPNDGESNGKEQWKMRWKPQGCRVQGAMLSLGPSNNCRICGPQG